MKVTFNCRDYLCPRQVPDRFLTANRVHDAKPGDHSEKTGHTMSLASALRPLGIALMVLLPYGPASAGSETGLALKQTIPLPEVDGRIDHFAVDVKGHRAFLAALAKNTIEVVDLKAGRVIKTLPGFAKPQGVRFVPEFNRLFVATGVDGALTTLDGSTLSVLRTAHVSLGADAIGYDPRTKYLYVGSGGGDANKETGDLTVFSAKTGDEVGALVTDAHAGGSVVETYGEHLYVLVPEKAQVLVLDRKTHAQVAKWTVPDIQKNVAIDLDERDHRLFLGVRTPASIVVLDSTSGAVIASIPTVGTLDGLAYDRARRRIYTTGGEGFIDVTQQIDPDHYERVARVPSGPSARTSLFVPEWHRLYVAVPRDKERSAELRAYDTVP
jgi:DNA-binding beta-propeller fold protein YncE